MTQNTVTPNQLTLNILGALGNRRPKFHQIKLVESLLLKTTIPHELLFNQILSCGEIECLFLAATGNTIEQTAHLLSVKTSTVMTLRKRILNKLGCRSMAQAVFMGIRYGYLSPGKISHTPKYALTSEFASKDLLSNK